jgi:hypothetical protein
MFRSEKEAANMRKENIILNKKFWEELIVFLLK